MVSKMKVRLDYILGYYRDSRHGNENEDEDENENEDEDENENRTKMR